MLTLSLPGVGADNTFVKQAREPYDAVKWPDVVRAVDEMVPNAHTGSTRQWRSILE
jgi:hypothetical protein